VSGPLSAASQLDEHAVQRLAPSDG
jgi:hypothetical protein